MKVETLQIAWHGRDGGKNDPILSCDFLATDSENEDDKHRPALMATAGADSSVRIWKVKPTANGGSEAVVVTGEWARDKGSARAARRTLLGGPPSVGWR